VGFKRSGSRSAAAPAPALVARLFCANGANGTGSSDTELAKSPGGARDWLLRTPGSDLRELRSSGVDIAMASISGFLCVLLSVPGLAFELGEIELPKAECSVGGNHNLCRSGDNWFVFGDNDRGQLGLGDAKIRPQPVLHPVLSEMEIEVCVSGFNHNLCKTSDGEWFGFGCNEDGQLGLGDQENRFKLTPLPALAGCDLCVVGANHNLCKKSGSKEWIVFGWNNEGQLGVGDMTDRLTPIANSKMDGFEHCEAMRINMCKKGQLWYGFGSNEHGEICMNDAFNRYEPERIPQFNDGGNVAHVNIGLEHTMFQTDDGKWFSCGAFTSHQNGILVDFEKNNFASEKPNKADDLVQGCSYCALGFGSHVLCKCEFNEWVVFGWGIHGQLGMKGKNFFKNKPTINKALFKSETCYSGAFHSVCPQEDGTLLTFGRNHKGQLGTGNLGEDGDPEAPAGLVGKPLTVALVSADEGKEDL
jgi:alpha-tubulin suppressor-like RCC1 family protein